MHRSNATAHVEVRFADGETIVEKYRDSIGGFARMMDRLAAHVGADRIRPVDPNADQIVWEGNGRTFTLEPVHKL